MAKPTLNEQLARLATLSPADLRTEWSQVHDAPFPKLVPALLRLGIAYRLQQQASGKRDRRVSGSPSAAPSPRPAARVTPGTQLVRSWNGRTVSVVAEEQGFLFSGKLYPSLSAIAREVTGAHWSGPRFFGLIGAEAARG